MDAEREQWIRAHPAWALDTLEQDTSARAGEAVAESGRVRHALCCHASESPGEHVARCGAIRRPTGCKFRDVDLAEKCVVCDDLRQSEPWRCPDGGGCTKWEFRKRS